jgi:glutaredoxin
MSQHDVIVYTSNGCTYCQQVKTFLMDNGIQFEERNVSVQKEYLDILKEKKIYATPATFINGNLILGFQEKKFNKLLGIAH